MTLNAATCATGTPLNGIVIFNAANSTFSGTATGATTITYGTTGGGTAGSVTGA